VNGGYVVTANGGQHTNRQTPRDAPAHPCLENFSDERPGPWLAGPFQRFCQR